MKTGVFSFVNRLRNVNSKLISGIVGIPLFYPAISLSYLGYLKMEGKISSVKLNSDFR
jgi:hypothetical protein